MKGLVKNIKQKRTQQQLLAEEVEALEEACERQLVKDNLNALKKKYPILQDLALTQYGYSLVFINNISISGSLTGSKPDSIFLLYKNAIKNINCSDALKQDYKYSDRDNAIDAALRVWRELDYEQFLPSRVKRVCAELTSEK